MGNAGVRRRSAALRDLVWAGLGLVAAVFAAEASAAVIARGLAPNLVAAQLLAYVSTWIPMILAVVFALVFGWSRLGWADAAGRLGLRLRLRDPLVWLDLIWGVAAGCLARAVDAIVRLQLFGSTGLAPGPTLGGPPPVAALIVIGILAPVLLAPVIEEVFFRGLLQRALARALTGTGRTGSGAAGSGAASGRRAAASVVAVVVTSALFALVHVLVSGEVGSAAVATAVGTATFALLAGAIVAATGRLGGAIAAHVVFNGVAVWLTWPA